MIRTMIAIGLVAGLVTQVLGGEVPNGADTIPYLTRSAKAIILTGDDHAKQLTVGRWAVVYEIMPAEVLKGKVPRDRPVRIAVQGALNGPEMLQNALVFVGSPLGQQKAETFGLPLDLESALPVLSGTKGVVPARGQRRSAVVDYLKTLDVEDPEKRTDEVQKWAAKYLAAKGDDLLQYSCVKEGTRAIAKDRRAVLFSKLTLNSPEVGPANKALVIRELGDSGSPEAGEILLDAARNPNTNDLMRRQMLSAVLRTPSGSEALAEVARDAQHPLAALAQEYLPTHDMDFLKPEITVDMFGIHIRFPGQNKSLIAPRQTINLRPPPALNADREAVLAAGKLLDSKEPLDRVRGLREINQMRPAAAKLLKPAVLGIARNPAGGDGERQIAIDVLANLDRDDENLAKIFQGIAFNRNEPKLVRAAAILGLGKMKAEVKAGPLNRLSQELDPNDPVEAELSPLSRP